MKRLLYSVSLLGLLAVPAGAVEQGAPIILAQSSNADYRVSVLEEQVRQLTGRLEELNFQLLEMQERMRRMQEDNEFRLQQIEERQGKLNGGNNDAVVAEDDGFIRLGKQEPSESQNNESVSGGNDTANETAKAPRIIDGVEIYDGESGVADNGTGSLGTLQFDENGNIIGTELGKPLDLTTGLTGEAVSNPLPQDPDQLFALGYDYVQSGNYEDAEVALVAFSDRHSTHPRLPEARFWLGESYLGRGQFKTAAEVYLDAHKRWPNGKYGPQSLLKLGVSVAGMDQRELACATFAEVIQKYPNASRVVQRAVAFEQRAAQCATN